MNQDHPRTSEEPPTRGVFRGDALAGRLSSEQTREVYKLWLAAFLAQVGTKASLGHRMKETVRNTYGTQDSRWLKFWPYNGGRTGRDVPPGTINGWFSRGSLPTSDDQAVEGALRAAMIEVVSAEVPVAPASTKRLLKSVSAEVSFANVVMHLGLDALDGMTPSYGVELQRAQKLMVDRLRRLPLGYPSHLDVVEMAGQIRVVEVDDLSEYIAGDGLYATRTPFGAGERGLGALREQGLTVVLGDPGSGKSTLLAAHCVNHVERAEGLAVFARLDDLARVAEERNEALTRDLMTPWSAADMLVEAWDNWRGGEKSPQRARETLVDQILGSQNTLIALDGLDEVELTDGRSDLVRDLITRLAAYSSAQIVVASRVTGYSRPVSESDIAVAEYFVMPWDEQEARALIGQWFLDSPGTGQPSGRDAALAALEGSGVSSLVRTPLVAGIVCYVAEEGSISTTIFGLYRQYLNRLLKRLWRPPSEQRRTTLEVNRARVAAQKAAWAMAQSETDVWLDSATLGWLLASSEADHELLLDLHYGDGLLVPFGEPRDTDPLSQNVRWIHRTIHEHLAARQLAEVCVKDLAKGVSIAARAALLPSWAVTLEHLSGALQESGLLERFAEAMWSLADQGDTPGQRLRGTSDDFLVRARVPDYMKEQVLASRLQHCDWWAVAEVDPEALFRHREHISMASPYACEVESYVRVTYALEPFPGTWDDLEGLAELVPAFDLAVDYWFERAAWKVDQRRMLELVLRRVGGGDYRPLVTSVEPVLEPAEAKHLVDVVDLAFDEFGDPRLLVAVSGWEKLLPEDQALRVREKVDQVLGSSLAAEFRAANAEGRVFDILAVDPGELSSYVSLVCDSQAFLMGWDMAEQKLPKLAEAGEWFLVGYELGSTSWERSGKATGMYVDPEPVFNSDWRTSPDAVRTVFRALRTCAKEPTVDRLTAFLTWCLAEDPTGWKDVGAITFDSSWMQSWQNSIDWHVRAITGLQVLRGDRMEDRKMRAVLEWTGEAIVAGLHHDSEAAMGLFEQYLAEVLTAPGADRRPAQHLAGIVRMLDEVPTETAQVACDLVLRLAESLPRSELQTVILDATDLAMFRAGLLPGVERRWGTIRSSQ